MAQENATSMVGVYWDFENIHASLWERAHGRDTWKEQRNYKAEWIVDVKAVMGFVASVGSVAINRAYNNWQNFACYRHDFHEFNVDLVQLYPRGMKNGADIRLVLDVIEDIHHYPHLTHIVVVGGDSDYISLAQKVQRSGRTIIGIGVRETSNQFWVRCCNEFKYYDTLESASAPTDDRTEVRSLLLRALRSVRLQRGDDLVPKATLKSVMKRLDASFDEARFGFDSFTAFIDAFADDIEHVRNDSGGLVRERLGSRPRTGEYIGLRTALQQPSRGGPPSDATGSVGPAPSTSTSRTIETGTFSAPAIAAAEYPQTRGLEPLSKSRGGQAYEQILKRGSVLPLPAQWRQRALSYLGPIFDEAPERRLASVDNISLALGKQLEAAGLDANRVLIERLKGNLLSLRMLKFHGPNGVGLHPRTDDGRLCRAVEEEMALRVVQQAALPVDLVAFSEVLFGSVTARAINEAEALLKEAAPDAPLTLDLISIVEHLGDPLTAGILEARYPDRLPRTNLRAMDLTGRFRLMPVLLLKKAGHRVQPALDEEIDGGDVLVLFGKLEEIRLFEQAGDEVFQGGALLIPA
jgi:NYN domain/OST-HTH/LOTUS domain